MEQKRVLFLVVFVIFYLFFGGLIFYTVEHDKDQLKYEQVVALEEIVQNITASDIGCSKENMTTIVKIVLEVASSGSYFRNNTAQISWTYATAVFFSATIITTIGYGVITPVTNAGYWLVIMYGIIGIPLNLVMLASIGQIMKRNVYVLILRLDDYFNPHRTPSVKVQRYLVLTFVLVFGGLIFLLIPSIVFMQVEMWTFTESFYFSFVTLSTIGFGDFTVTTERHATYAQHLTAYRLGVTVWMFVGLAWLSTLFSTLSELIDHGITINKMYIKRRLNKAKVGVRPPPIVTVCGNKTTV